MIWLNVETLKEIHDEIIDACGGRPGIRDESLLESALGRPANQVVYEPDSDVFILASLYAHGIAANHPFVDGNRRTAFVSAYAFLVSAGYALSADPAMATEAMIMLATDELTTEEFAQWLRDNSETMT